MNALKNRVQLIGRLGKNPESRTFDSGKMMTTFSLATNESYKNNKGEKVEDTQWHNIVAWGKVAELSNKLLQKGQEVAIEGKLVSRSYEKNGEKKYVTEIVMNEMLLISNGK